MKEIRNYGCEICGTVYSEKARAVECEKSHKRPGKVMSGDYYPYSVDKQGYPIKIHVKMSDGNVVSYKKLSSRGRD